MEPAFNTFLSLHSVADKAGLGRADADLLEFSKGKLTELSERFLLDQGNRINRVASTMHKVSGDPEALDLLVRSLEREPEWLRSVYREYWRAFSWSLARYRSGAWSRALDKRLLPLALRELRADLGHMNWRNTALFHRGRYFWSGAAGEFAAAAQDFLAKNEASVAKVVFAANYLWGGLNERSAAVDALAALHEKGRLHESGRWQLARWYQESRDWKPAIPLLEGLIEERQDRLDYRLALVAVHFGNRDKDAAHTLLRATTERWKEKKWWNESSMASLAKAAFEARFYEEAAAWYEEAVRANERGGASHWNWRHTRSTYYGFLAKAHARLGNVDQAIDAASAAVVTWGSSQNQRKEALKALHRVVAGIEDLTGYVKRWDAKVAETGLDAPLIRKEIGIVFLERGEPKNAIAQLELARELAPLDDEVHARLLDAFDRAGDRTGALAALRASIRMSPMSLELYSRLASRLARGGDERGAERAYTSLVEVRPNEAESHRQLAKVREGQKRFGEAVVQWRQVVRVRTDEPAGWLGLATAQIHAGDLEGAKKTLDHVETATWDARFPDVGSKARTLRRLLDRKGG